MIVCVEQVWPFTPLISQGLSDETRQGVASGRLHLHTPTAMSLEDTVTAVYGVLDDALAEGKVECRNGKVIRRRGPRPDMEDREVLCLAVLQELLQCESDNRFFLWAANDPTMRDLFRRALTRQKFTERRALVTPLMQRLCQAFCVLCGEGQPTLRGLMEKRSGVALQQVAPEQKAAAAVSLAGQ